MKFLAIVVSVFLALAAGLPQDSPEATVDAFHAAITSGDRDAALGFLDQDVVIFESGGAEMSRDEYASHHLEGDMKFAASAERSVTGRRSDSDSDTAWVLTRTETHGTFGEREIHSRGTETMLLRRIDGAWKIAHIHWSSGRIRPQS